MSAAALRRNGICDRGPWLTDGAKGLRFENSGLDILRVPGFAEYPVDTERAAADRFAHCAHDWSQQRLTAKEMAMLRLMNRLTDISNWHSIVFDDNAVASWRPEPLGQPLISDQAWDWCITELRDKARCFQQDRYVSIFDAASGLIKSDHLISSTLLNKFRVHLASLMAEAEVTRPSSPSQPQAEDHGTIASSRCRQRQKSSKQLVRLVDPKMNPLIYGASKVLSAGGQVDLDNVLASVGRGELAPAHPWGDLPDPETVNKDKRFNSIEDSPWFDDSTARPYLFSRRSQWLPCEVSFAGEPGTTDVRITSYINNLHPDLHKPLYAAIEETISLSIEPWNQVLVRSGGWLRPPRIRAYGVEWEPPYPEWAWNLPKLEQGPLQLIPISPSLLYPENTEALFQETSEESREAYKKAWKDVLRFVTLPDPVTDEVREPLWARGGGVFLEHEMRAHYSRVRTNWHHSEPGEAFSFEEWKARRAHNSVIPPKYLDRKDLAERPEFQYDEPVVRLQDTFREQGLQVIVKLHSIELTSEEPELA